MPAAAFNAEKCLLKLALAPNAEHDQFGMPSAAQLDLINHYTVREHTAEETYTRQMFLAHNALDRDKEIISDELIVQLATTLPGKGLFVKHPNSWDGDSGPGEGRFYQASIVEMSFDQARAALKSPDLKWADESQTAKLLQASFYMVKSAAPEGLIEKIDAGIAGDVSISFGYAESVPVIEDNKTTARRLLGPGEAYEGSLVWLGAQPGARITKNHSRDQFKNPDKKTEEFLMPDNTELLDSLKADKTALSNQVTSLTDQLSAVKSVFSDIENTDFAAIKALSEHGQKYNDSLVDDVVSARRQLGMIDGDDKDAVAAAKALYASFTIEQLISESKTLAKALGDGDSSGNASDDPNHQQDETGLRQKGATLTEYGVK